MNFAIIFMNRGLFDRCNFDSLETEHVNSNLKFLSVPNRSSQILKSYMLENCYEFETYCHITTLQCFVLPCTNPLAVHGLPVVHGKFLVTGSGPKQYSKCYGSLGRKLLILLPFNYFPVDSPICFIFRICDISSCDCFQVLLCIVSHGSIAPLSAITKHFKAVQ